jgi:hypothetical protein
MLRITAKNLVGRLILSCKVFFDLVGIYFYGFALGMEAASFFGWLFQPNKKDIAYSPTPL